MVPALIGLLVAAVVVAGVVMVRRRGPRALLIDPFTLSEPWRRHVADALSAQRRYEEIARATAEGPLHDRLQQISVQVQQAVQECFEIARRGDDLDETLRRFDTTSLQHQLQRATDDGERTSLQSQLAAAERIRTTRDDTNARLKLLTTRMGELVAQAAEVSVGTDSTDQLGSGVGDVVTELEALRLALNDVNNTGRPASSP